MELFILNTSGNQICVLIQDNQMTVYKKIEGVDTWYECPIVYQTKQFNIKVENHGSKQFADAGVCLYDGAYCNYFTVEYTVKTL